MTNEDNTNTGAAYDPRGEIDVVPEQRCTNAAYANVWLASSPHGGLCWLSGFNTMNGAEACFLLMVRSALVVTVSASDDSGLAIAFRVVDRQLRIKCGSRNVPVHC